MLQFNISLYGNSHETLADTLVQPSKDTVCKWQIIETNENRNEVLSAQLFEISAILILWLGHHQMSPESLYYISDKLLNFLRTMVSQTSISKSKPCNLELSLQCCSVFSTSPEIGIFACLKLSTDTDYQNGINYKFNSLWFPTSNLLTIFFLMAFCAAAFVATRSPSAASLRRCCWSSFSGLAAAPCTRFSEQIPWP